MILYCGSLSESDMIALRFDIDDTLYSRGSLLLEAVVEAGPVANDR